MTDTTVAEDTTPNPFKAVEFTPEGLNRLYEIYGSDVEQGVAKLVLNELNSDPRYEGKAGYEDVISGRADIIRMLPGEQASKLYGKGLSDNQIIQLFSGLKSLGEDGAPTEVDAFLRGITRGGTTFAGGVAGAKLAAAAAPAYVPLPGPLAPFGVLSKPVAGFTGFVVGSILADSFLGQKLADAVAENPERALLTPSAERAFRSFESAGNVGPFILMPYLAPRAVLNSAYNIRNLPVANQATVITAEQAENPLIQRYLSGKLAGRPNRIQMEQRRNQIFTEAEKAADAARTAARNKSLEESARRGITGRAAEDAANKAGDAAFNKTRLTLKEAAARASKEVPDMGFFTRNAIRGIDYVENALVGGGQSFRQMGPVGKGVTLGVEAAAAPATGGLVYMSEGYAPRSEGARLGAETIGSLAPSLSILKYMPRLFSMVGEKRRLMAEGKARGEGRDLFGIKNRARRRAIDDIFDVLQANQEDPDTILANLEAYLVDPVTDGKGNVVNYTLKKEILDAFGSRTPEGGDNLPIFSSQYMDSAALTQLENAVMGRSGQRGALEQARDASFNKSQEIQRGLIYALRGTGDTELVKMAGEMMQDRISLLIAKRMEDAVQKNIDAIRQIYPEGGEKARRALGEALSNTVKDQEKLFRALERRAWGQVDQKQVLDKFYRADPETGDLVENPVPNIFEEWDAIVDELDPLKKNVLRARVPEFGLLNDRIMELKSQIGFSSVNKLDELSETQNFRKAFDTAEGRPGRGLYNRTYNRVVSGVMGDQPFDEANLSEQSATALIEALGREESKLLTGRKAARGGEDRIAASLLGLKRQELIARRSATDARQASGVVSDPITVQNIVSIYSEMRNLGRRLAESDPSWARYANAMAEAALDDLNGMPNGRGAYDAARDMSFAFNEYLRRAFPGEIMRTTPRGKRVVDPGMVTTKLFSGQPDAVSIRLDQIQEVNNEIVKRLNETGYPITVEVFETVTDPNGAVRQVTREIEMGELDVKDQIGNADETLSNMLRLAIRDVTTRAAIDRRMSPKQVADAQDLALMQWREKYSDLLESFPAVQKMIEEADSTADFLLKSDRVIKRLDDRVKDAKAFQALIGHENPTKAVEAAWNSKNPMKELDSLVEILNAAADPSRRAKYSGRINFSEIDLEQARSGLQKAVMDFVFTRGGKGSEDGFSPSAVYNAVFDKIPNARGDTNTLGNWMVANKIISEPQLNSMQQGLRALIAAEGRKLAGDVVFTADAPLLLDFYTRLAGARLGTMVGGMMGGRSATGAGLIEAEAGSRFLRKITQELPALSEYDALENILLDPELLAMALRKGRTNEAKAGALNFILDKLKIIGISLATPAPARAIPLGVMEYGEEEVGPLPKKEPAPEPETPGTQGSVRPPAVPTRTVAAVQPPPIPPRPAPTPVPQSVASAPTQAPASPATRQRYAALFPNDSASSMIRSQGIGGLLG